MHFLIFFLSHNSAFKILDALNRKMLLKLLQSKNCICTEEKNGLDALNNIKNMLKNNINIYMMLFLWII